MNMLVSTAAVASSIPLAELENEDRLRELQDQILAAYELALQHDDEISRLHKIWTDEYLRLHGALDVLAHSEGRSPTREEMKAIKGRVGAMPETQQFNRLNDLADPHFSRMDALTREMWSIPAATPKARAAKLSVFFATIAHKDWLDSDNDADFDIEMCRKLLLEFAGEEASREWKEHFARKPDESEVAAA